MATIAQLIADSEQIRDETIPGANSANRVGTLFKNISETFETIGVLNGEIGFSINNLLVPRNGFINLAELDFTTLPVAQRSASFIFEWSVMGVIGVNPGDFSISINSARGAQMWVVDRNSSGVVDSNIFINASSPASRDPGVNDLVEVIVGGTFITNTRFLIELENFCTGTGTADPFFSGSFKFIFPQTRPLPTLTFL